MNTFQKNSLFVAAILLVLIGASALGYYGYQDHLRSTEERRIAWKKENIRELKDLSRIGILSTEEQARLDSAGDDVDRIQQVLLDLHTERHTIWTAHKDDVEERQRKLSSLSYVAGYEYSAQYREAQSDLRKEAQEVAENLAGYEAGLFAIRAWRPMSLESFEALPSKQVMAPSQSAEYEPQKPSATIPDEKPAQAEAPSLTTIATESQSPIADGSAPTSAQNALDNVDVEISAALHTWSQAMVSNDPDKVARCYTPHVDRYFLKLDVSNDDVKTYMQEWLSHGAKHIDAFSTKEVTFETETADSAKLRLVKDMTITDSSGTVDHLIRSRLYLRKDHGFWLIASEQDFKN